MAGRACPIRMSSYRPLPHDSLRVGERTMFALRDRTGCLLVPKGTLVESDEQLRQLTARDLYVDEQDGEMLRRALGGKLDGMLRENQTLGRMASARPEAADMAASTDGPRRLDDPARIASDLQQRLGATLRDLAAPDFAARLQQAQRALAHFIDSDADDALLLLVHEATGEFRDYSTSQALLVAALCELAARHLGPWTPEQRQSLRCAALTMNVAMAVLQNQLALQTGPVDAAQRAQIDAHAMQGARMLRDAGIADPLWLGAVEHHHDAPPGPLAALPLAMQFARLIKRADVFVARMRPRRTRAALSATAAAKTAYLDEQGRPDEAGSAIIKATGLYPPGSFVRLASGETAVVLKRGARAGEPVVASLVNASGFALGEPALRQTKLPAHKVSGGVAPTEVKVRLNLERLLKLS